MTALPTLASLLGEARGDGFEEWCKASLFAEEWPTDEGTKATHRILRVLCVAMIEVTRTEDALEMNHVETLARIGRGLGLAFMVMATAPMREDAPPKATKEMAKIARKLFREGVEYWMKLEQGTPI